MTRKDPPVYPEVLNYLRQEGETFNLLKPDSQEALTTAEWINNFPIASWGRIDWSKVPNSSCKTWTNDSELLSAFKRILVESKLDEKLEISVIVLWGNALTPPLQINLNVLLKYANEIFYEDWDTWVYSESDNWLIEVYHEEEICFGRYIIAE